MLRDLFSYVLGFVFLRLGSGILTFGVRDSYVSELVLLRLEVRDCSVQGLVFLRSGFRNSYVSSKFSHV